MVVKHPEVLEVQRYWILDMLGLSRETLTTRRTIGHGGKMSRPRGMTAEEHL